jgi:hypothetical protein
MACRSEPAPLSELTVTGNVAPKLEKEMPAKVNPPMRKFFRDIIAYGLLGGCTS